MKKKISFLLVLMMAIGVFCAMPLAAAAESQIVGDADMNGAIEANDAATVLRHVVRISELTGQALINADANCDGEVNSQDSALILRYVVKLETVLPPSGGTLVTPPITNTPPPTATPTPTPTPTPFINRSLGDVDLNGNIEAADASMILRYLVRLTDLTDIQLKNADVTFDEQVSASDAARILRYIVRLISDLNIWPDPTAVPTVTPTPTATPVPTNKDGLPAAGTKGLIVPDDDPNYERIMGYYLNRSLWTNELNPNNSSYSESEFWTSSIPQRSFRFITVNMQGKTERGLNGAVYDYTANNEDIIGWVRMAFYGKENNRSRPYTANIGISDYRVIDEPIMYDPYGRQYYFDHTCYGLETAGGSLMAYYDTLAKNIVVTGHNSRPTKTHFHHLHTMQSGAKYYGSSINPDNYIFDISIFGLTKWQVWAMYETSENEPSSTLLYNISSSCGTDGNVQNWINTQLTRSEVNFKVSVSTNDQFLTLYTCADAYDSSDDTTQARLYVFLKYVG
ncbi:MAG: dockerin type I domain-containing protein [Clostridia bacterium]|nr:dockerin type I domain-containing protein [Clostridia bacterium]